MLNKNITTGNSLPKRSPNISDGSIHIGNVNGKPTMFVRFNGGWLKSSLSKMGDRPSIKSKKIDAQNVVQNNTFRDIQVHTFHENQLHITPNIIHLPFGGSQGESSGEMYDGDIPDNDHVDHNIMIAPYNGSLERLSIFTAEGNVGFSTSLNVNGINNGWHNGDLIPYASTIIDYTQGNTFNAGDKLMVALTADDADDWQESTVTTVWKYSLA